jgi:hypothetical protein
MIEPTIEAKITSRGASKPVRRNRTRGSTSSDAPQPTRSSTISRRYGSSSNGKFPGSE